MLLEYSTFLLGLCSNSDCSESFLFPCLPQLSTFAYVFVMNQYFTVEELQLSVFEVATRCLEYK